MKFGPYYRKVFVLVFALALMSFNASYALAQDDYRFVVQNKTKTTIKKILVGEPGKTYRPFSIGNGIAPGKSMTLVWDNSADTSACEWYVKAVYSDGVETEPAIFDFCEKGLEIVFTR